jgi:hypothetical protein
LPLRGPSLFSFLHPPLCRRLLDLLELLLLLSFRRLQLFIDLLLLKTAPPPPRIQNPPPRLLQQTQLPLPEFHLQHFLPCLPTRLAPPQFLFRLGGLGFHLSQAQHFVAQEAGLFLPLLGGHTHALALVRPFVEHEYAVGPALGVAGCCARTGSDRRIPVITAIINKGLHTGITVILELSQGLLGKALMAPGINANGALLPGSL